MEKSRNWKFIALLSSHFFGVNSKCYFYFYSVLLQTFRSHSSNIDVLTESELKLKLNGQSVKLEAICAIARQQQKRKDRWREREKKKEREKNGFQPIIKGNCLNGQSTHSSIRKFGNLLWFWHLLVLLYALKWIQTLTTLDLDQKILFEGLT